MATENPGWGYTRLQGALKNLGHRVARSILKQHGVPPSPERPTSWETFLRAYWGALVAADFFTTEVWTVRGLVTYYTLFVIELESRRSRFIGSTPHPDDAFMRQIIDQKRICRRRQHQMLQGERTLSRHSQVLENQTAVSARENDREPNKVDEPSDHGQHNRLT